MGLTSQQEMALHNAGVSANITRMLVDMLGGSFTSGTGGQTAPPPRPTYAAVPVAVPPTPVAPPPAPPAPPAKIYAAVIEGLRVGVATIKSTGRVHFEEITSSSGWRFPERAQFPGDGETIHPATPEYTGKLIGKKPYFTIPANARVRGIKVYVVRRRI